MQVFLIICLSRSVSKHQTVNRRFWCPNNCSVRESSTHHQGRNCIKQFEGYCQITLCMLAPYRLNSINELEANLKQSDKNKFCPYARSVNC